METSIKRDQLKDLIKTAMVEVLEERQDLIRDTIEDVMEDIGLSRAILEGEKTEMITRKEVFHLLKE
jgi:hypothetical protein